MIIRWSDYTHLSSLQFHSKNKELSTWVFKREKVFTMIPNLLEDFPYCSSEFLIVFIPSLSIISVGERNRRYEWVKMRKITVMHEF